MPRWLKLTLMFGCGGIVFLIGGLFLLAWLAFHFRPDPARNAAPVGAPLTLAGVDDLSSWLETIRAKEKVPALAAVVLHGDTIVAAGVTGVREAGQPERVTLQDAFHLGSDTKAMTATMIARLVEQGKLRWDSTIGDVFGSAVPTMDPAWRKVTLTQLLTHRAGVSGDMSEDGLWRRLCELRGTPVEQRMELVRGVLARPPLHRPGTKFLYSNGGYAIAGAMAETVTGRSWEDLMQAQLFQPLGITTAGFGAPGTPGKHDQPLGHSQVGSAIQLGPQADNPESIGPAGRVHMSITDWAKFITLHLRGDAANPHRKVSLLRPETFDFLHRPAEGPGQVYACGWGVMEEPATAGAAQRGRMLVHDGSNTLWYCIVRLEPDRDWAVLVACNQGGTHGLAASKTAASQASKRVPTNAPQ